MLMAILHVRLHSIASVFFYSDHLLLSISLTLSATVSIHPQTTELQKEQEQQQEGETAPHHL